MKESAQDYSKESSKRACVGLCQVWYMKMWSMRRPWHYKLVAPFWLLFFLSQQVKGGYQRVFRRNFKEFMSDPLNEDTILAKKAQNLARGRLDTIRYLYLTRVWCARLQSTKMPSWFLAVFFILPKHFGDSITSTPTIWWSWPVSITPPPKERTQKRAWDYVGAQFRYVSAIFSQILPCKFCFTHSYITASNATAAVKVFFESSSFACINITRYSIWCHNRSQNEC